MYDVAVSTLPFLLEGLWMTFKISLITIFFGSIVGVVVGMLRTLDYAVPREDAVMLQVTNYAQRRLGGARA